MDNKEKFEDKIFFGKYKPEKKIGEGSFGKIYSAININSNEKFALKIENKSTGQNLLESEAYVVCYLKGLGIPSIKSYGFSGDYNILVMELLGKSLEDLFQECGCKFSMKTVCMLALQMLERIEFVHSRHIIHRDIKPDNFIMGLNENVNLLYIIDFGLAKKYRSSRTLQHIRFTNNKKLTGTARYASINALRGAEQSRRDDLEAIGYVLMYFLRGSLPWQGLKVDKREDRYKKIYEKKKSTTAEELCEGFPSEFIQYIEQTRSMGYEEEPDYEGLKDLFRKIMERNGYVDDKQFDWLLKKNSLNANNTNSSNDLNPNSNIPNFNMTMQAVYNKTNNNTMANKDKMMTITEEKLANDTKFMNNMGNVLETNNLNNKEVDVYNNKKMLETFNNTNIKNDKNLIKNNQSNVNTLVNMAKDDNSKAIGKVRGAVTENYNNTISGKDKTEIRDGNRNVNNTENLNVSSMTNNKKKDKQSKCCIL